MGNGLPRRVIVVQVGPLDLVLHDAVVEDAFTHETVDRVFLLGGALLLLFLFPGRAVFVRPVRAVCDVAAGHRLLRAHLRAVEGLTDLVQGVVGGGLGGEPPAEDTGERQVLERRGRPRKQEEESLDLRVVVVHLVRVRFRVTFGGHGGCGRGGGGAKEVFVRGTEWREVRREQAHIFVSRTFCRCFFS